MRELPRFLSEGVNGIVGAEDAEQLPGGDHNVLKGLSVSSIRLGTSSILSVWPAVSLQNSHQPS